MLKKMIHSFFHALGVQITRWRPPQQADIFYMVPMKQGLERYAGLGEPINTVVDLGAAQGHWSLVTKSIFPNASYLLFEPLSERKLLLEDLVKLNPTFHFLSAAAGKEQGEVFFNVTADLDGSGIYSSESNNSRRVEVRSVQDEVRRLGLQGPYLIKLDTHGFEVPILEGCTDIMNQVSVFIIECYGFHVAPGSLLFWEMCKYMDDKGFRLYDIVDVMHREVDKSFWQCDAFFIPKTNSVFNHNSYSR